jgi:hypothetical protein
LARLGTNGNGTRLEELIRELDELNMNDWSQRVNRGGGPDRMNPKLLAIKTELLALGVAPATLDYILEKSANKLMAYEKITVALFLQVIQDISYPEHNLAQIKELRDLQKLVRLEYNAHQIMQRHRKEVIHLIRKAGFKASENKGNIAIEVRVMEKDGQMVIAPAPAATAAGDDICADLLTGSGE